jgi:hypothetical protein
VIRLNTDADRFEWLACLQAAASISTDRRTALEVAAIADSLYAELRRRVDG